MKNMDLSKNSGNDFVSQKGLVNATLSIKDYLDAVYKIADARSRDIVSILIFGSAATGGFSYALSDVDLMIVLADHVSRDIRDNIRDELSALERQHGLSELPKGRRRNFYAICDQKIGGLKSLTICYKSDLLLGNPSAVFEVKAFAEWLLLSTHIFCFASIFTSARTLWGENLLACIPIPALTRKHLTKNLITHLLRNMCAFGGYLFLPNGTKYAMGILKGFLHDCFFVYTAKNAPLEEKIKFFRTKLGGYTVFDQLLSLRKDYRPSPSFIFGCFEMLVRLYIITLRENTFPAIVENDLVLPSP